MSDTSTLSDRLGTVRTPTAEEQAKALAAAMRNARDEDEAAMFRSMLGLEAL